MIERNGRTTVISNFSVNFKRDMVKGHHRHKHCHRHNQYNIVVFIFPVCFSFKFVLFFCVIFFIQLSSFVYAF